MKIKIACFLAFAFIAIFTASCYFPPEFDETPSISFNRLEFVDVKTDQDSLNLTIYFEDGDGNLGLYYNEIDPPYHPFSFVRANDKYLTISSNDTMPAFNCSDYLIGYFEGGSFETDISTPEAKAKADTFYVNLNRNFYNIFVDFEVKEGGKFTTFDWVNAPNTGCGFTKWGRFAPLYEEDRKNKPLSGTLTYRMLDFGFLPYFKGDTLRLQVQIQDRDLNKSNIIKTPEFILDQNGIKWIGEQ